MRVATESLTWCRPGPISLALTGGSNVIHELNERLGGPRDGYVLDYVEFFCSFVAGDEGPFVVPRTDEERDEVATQDGFAEHSLRLQQRLILGDGVSAPSPPRERQIVAAGAAPIAAG